MSSSNQQIAFSPSQYWQLIKKIENALKKVGTDANTVVNLVESQIGKAGADAALVEAALAKFATTLSETVTKVTSFLARDVAVAPTMWEWAAQYNQMSATAGQSAARLTHLMEYQNEWGGIDGGKYATAVSLQGPAVAQIQAMANSMVMGCAGTAIDIFAFYLAVAAALVDLITGLAAAIVGLAGAETGIALVAGLLALLAATAAAGIAIAEAEVTLKMGLVVEGYTFDEVTHQSGSFEGPLFGNGPEHWPGATN